MEKGKMIQEFLKHYQVGQEQIKKDGEKNIMVTPHKFLLGDMIDLYINLLISVELTEEQKEIKGLIKNIVNNYSVEMNLQKEVIQEQKKEENTKEEKIIQMKK